MTGIGESFIAGLGKPKPAAKPDIPLDPMTGIGDIWNDVSKEIGAGYFLDGFLYLFGEDVRAWDPCVEAWSFMYPRPETKRLLIGRNAYGALVLLEDPDGKPRVGILDPPTMTYYSQAHLDLIAFIGRFLPEREGPESFWHSEPYASWAAESKEPLGMDAILGMTVPLHLGGTWDVSNFVIREPVEYHRRTAAAFR
jgi:hypothetical protein